MWSPHWEISCRVLFLLGLSEWNGINSALFLFCVLIVTKRSSTTAHAWSVNACVWPLQLLVYSATAFVDNSSIDVSEWNSIAITLNIHTKSHTVRSRRTLKLVERFGNGSVRELYERSTLYERSFTSEPSIKKYQAQLAISNELFHVGIYHTSE